MRRKQKTPAIGQDSRGLQKGSLARLNQILGKFLNIFQQEVSHVAA